METLLLTLLLLVLFFAAMAVGLFFGRGPIKGSCGGIAALTGDRQCDLCGGDRLRCEEISAGNGDGKGGSVRRYDPRKPD